MNKLPKFIRYTIVLQLSFDSIIQLAFVNKVWYKTQSDANFWLLKLQQDFPKLMIPYKDSPTKRIYQSEWRRQNLLDKFKFESDCDWCYGIPYFNDIQALNSNSGLLGEMDSGRLIAILSEITQFNLYNPCEINLYGVYENCWFEIFGNKSIYYHLERFSGQHLINAFEKDLTELINTTQPRFQNHKRGQWSTLNEYFGRRHHVPYPQFKVNPSDVICLTTDMASDQWVKFLSIVRATKSNLVMVRGMYYGREFYIHYNGRGSLELYVEPLLSKELVSNLVLIFDGL